MENPFAAARSLRQTSTAWESTVRHARVWIAPENEPPRRPYIILTVSQDGKVRSSEIVEHAPVPSQVADAVAKAMLQPVAGGGKKGRPATIYLDDEKLVAALAPGLQEVGVRCRYKSPLRIIDRTIRSLERYIHEREPILGLLRSPSVTAGLARRLYEAAATFYREALWRWLDDSCPIEVRHPPDAPPRYAVVMGHGAQTYGLAVYNSPDELLEVYTGEPFDALFGEVEWSSLIFCQVTEVPFDDLDDIERYGWPVVDEHAYPVPLRISHSGHPFRPGKSELLWFEAVLLALCPFVRHHMQAEQGTLAPADTTMAITTADGEAQVALRYPAPGIAVPAGYRGLVRRDNDPEVVAAHERNYELADLFEDWLNRKGLSVKTVRQHIDNVEFFAQGYMAIDGGNAGVPRSADQADRMDVDDYMGGWFLEQSPWLSETRVKANVASLKKFYAWLKESGRIEAETADEILELLKKKRGRYVELAIEYLVEEAKAITEWARRMDLES